MILLSWQTALLVGAIAIPLLILLYFLKLRRREHRISSTLLWKRAVHDLQVNAPFQKLRRNLLLFLQLLVLGAIIFGLANPVMNFVKRQERNIVLLVDRSGSMKTIEPDGRTRMEHVKDAAAQFVSNLADGSRAMVISFADRANVACSFTDDKRRLERQIREVEPTDACSKIGEALQLAVAYSASLVDERGGGGVPEAAQRGAADIELFSDGRIADADEQYVTRGSMQYYKIGEAADNVGIVAFSARRHYERPGMLSVFAEVENFGPRPIRTDVSILLDGRLLPGPGSIKEIELGPAAAPTSGPARPDDTAALASRQTVIFEMQHESGGVVEVRLSRDDALALDNRVVAPIDPPRQVRVLAVSDRADVRWFLNREFVESLEIKDFKLMTGQEYESAPDKALIAEGRSAFDLVVLDNHDTARLPPGDYVFLGGLPRVKGYARGEEVEGRVLALWNESHPLLRSVGVDRVFISKWKRLTLPEHAVKLIEGEDSVVLALVTEPGHRYVISAFDVLDTNLPLQPAFPIFLQNAVMYLAGGGLLDEGRLIRPGDTMSLPVPPGAQNVRIDGPDGREENLEVQGRHSMTFAHTYLAGVYRAVFDDKGRTANAFAVNTLDPIESLITPNETFTIGAEQVASVTGQVKVNEPLWPWAAGAALLVLLVEWWIYNKRVML
ncbi:MAG TPA: VWA domain-containing protein [Phycisphaerae bacterium]|nr:VWA domain-containing protein [Phycisphaerae bacterium]